MAATQQCADSRPHGPHVWSEPAGDGTSRQVQYQCPGVSADPGK